MSDTTKYEKLRIRAKLTVEVGAHLGVPEFIDVPISSASGCSEENGIPFCVVQIATGRDAHDEFTKTGLSPIHVKGDLLRLPTRATLRIKVEVEDATVIPDQTWPEDWFVVFDGWVSDVSPSVRVGSSSFTVRLTHLLSDLDFSSPYTEDAFPTTPADFLFNAATVFGTGLQRAVLGSTAVSRALSHFTSQSIVEDFWDNSNDQGLRPFLQAVADERLLNWRQIQAFTGISAPTEVRENRLLKSALARFEPFYDADAAVALYEYGCPLSLRTDLDGFGQIAARIRHQISEAARSPIFIGTTMWERLISGLASQYMFSVIPMSDRVLTVPYTPWMSKPWAAIWNDEFDLLDHSLQSRRPIKAVAVVGAYGSYTGLRSDKQAGGNVNGQRRVLGYYEPPATTVNSVRDGMTMYVEAPAWINDLLLHGISSYTAPLSGRIPLSAVPSLSAEVSAMTALMSIVRDKADSGVALANALAKATYLQEATKWRQAVISTALRFDIAPGSTLAIYSSPDKMVRSVLKQHGFEGSETMIGRAVRVSWTIDMSGNSPTASTVFHIAYLRTFAENEDAAFAADDHPLWRSTWRGAPLVGLEEFNHPSS